MTRAKGCLILFILSVIAGTIAGYFLVKIDDPPPPTTTPAPLTVDPTSSTDPNRSVLVLGVDDLQSPSPALEGIWIVSLLQNTDGGLIFKVITLYPVVEEHVSSTLQLTYTKPHSRLMINPDELDTLRNLAPISFSYDQWSQIIILDEIAINTIILMQNLNFHPPAPTPRPGSFVKPWKNPRLAYDQHKRILTLLCENPTPLGDPHNIDILLAMEGAHIQSTLETGELRSLWQVINYVPGKQVTCIFSP